MMLAAAALALPLSAAQPAKKTAKVKKQNKKEVKASKKVGPRAGGGTHHEGKQLLAGQQQA